MANLENNPIDTRTFVQICEGLSKREWVELQGELSQKTKKTGQCIYYWKKGEKNPISVLDRVAVSNHINKKYNINTRHWTLFPY